MLQNIEADLKGRKERTLHMSEVQDQALIFTRSPGVYSHCPRRRYLFHASVLERATHF